MEQIANEHQQSIIIKIWCSIVCYLFWFKRKQIKFDGIVNFLFLLFYSLRAIQSSYKMDWFRQCLLDSTTRLLVKYYQQSLHF
jgi:hypothetical protein